MALQVLLGSWRFTSLLMYRSLSNYGANWWNNPAFFYYDFCLVYFILLCHLDCIGDTRIQTKVSQNIFTFHFVCCIWNVIRKVWSKLGFRMMDILPSPNADECYFASTHFKNEYKKNHYLFIFKFSFSTFNSCIFLFLFQLDRIYALLENTIYWVTTKLKRHLATWGLPLRWRDGITMKLWTAIVSPLWSNSGWL